jgi:hypothetical protein
MEIFHHSASALLQIENHTVRFVWTLEYIEEVRLIALVGEPTLNGRRR